MSAESAAGEGGLSALRRGSSRLTSEFPVGRLIEEVRGKLAALLPPGVDFGGATRLAPPKDVRDDALKLRVTSAREQPLAVVICANPRAPLLVERGVRNIAAASALLPPHLAACILRPLASGLVDGLSYVVLPYRRPLSNSRMWRRLQRIRLQRHVLEWLRGVAAASRRTPTAEQVESCFVRPLEFMAGYRQLQSHVRRAALDALHRLRDGAWPPSITLAHNDLWEGNILLPERNAPPRDGRGPRPRFYIIDWLGASMEGHAVYDLIRVAMSFRTRRRVVRREITAWCGLLACGPSELIYDLLAALGMIGMNPESFPLERFTRLSDECVGYARRVTHG